MKRDVVSLYNYQEIGINTIMNSLSHGTYHTNDNDYANTRCFLLFDEMGLGKTIQACEVVKRMNLEPVLVVGPAACLHVWQESGFTLVSYDKLMVAYREYLGSYQSMSNDQLKRLCRLHEQVNPLLKNIRGDDLRKELLLSVRSIVIRHRNIGIHSELFTKNWACIIMDEAHKFKNPKSIRAKAVGMLQGTYRICLTGTPVMNHGGDLLSIFKHGLGLLDANWTELINNPNGIYCKQLMDMVTLGRKKTQLEELTHVLPKRKKDDEIVLLDWTDFQQRAHYYNMKEEAIRSYNSHHLTFMAKIQILRQICLHPGQPVHRQNIAWSPETHKMFHPWIQERLNVILGMTQFSQSIRICIAKHFVDYEQNMIQPSPKMLAVLQMYRPRVKMLVYCTYRSFLVDTMKPWLTQIGIKSILFAGGMNYKVIEHFRTDPTIDIMLVVKSVGAEGINMQDVCNHCIIMDPHFNLALDEQAAQRIDRLGQSNDEVIIRRLFMKGSIDEAMQIMQQEKLETTESWTGSGKKSLEVHHLFLTKYDTVVP